MPGPKETQQRKGLLHFKGYSSLLREVRAGPPAGQAAGAEAEAMAECCLLICSSWLTQPASLCTPGPLPSCVTTYKWAKSSHINHQPRKFTSGLPTGQSGGAFSQSGFTLQNDRSLCQVDTILDSTATSSTHGCSQKMLH